MVTAAFFFLDLEELDRATEGDEGTFLPSSPEAGAGEVAMSRAVAASDSSGSGFGARSTAAGAGSATEVAGASTLAGGADIVMKGATREEKKARLTQLGKSVMNQ